MGPVEYSEMADGFADLDSGHRELVTVTKFNFYGNRLVTASSDHRMKVWDQKDGQWNLTDTWRAHDAEVRDVRSEQSSGYVIGHALMSKTRQHGMVRLPASILAA